jgi:hypothetical protein
VRLGFSWTHVQSHFTDDRLRDHHIHAIDARQIHSGDALQFISEMEVRIVLATRLVIASTGAMLIVGHEAPCRFAALACRIESRIKFAKGETLDKFLALATRRRRS